EPAVVFEPFADPGGDDLGVEVGVVAGGIPGGEDMTEVGGAVSRRHERVEPGGGEDLGFEGEHIGDVLSSFERMPRQAEHGRREVLDRVEALPEPSTLDQLGDAPGRNRLTVV